VRARRAQAMRRLLPVACPGREGQQQQHRPGPTVTQSQGHQPIARARSSRRGPHSLARARSMVGRLAPPPVARDRGTQTQGPLASRAPGRTRPVSRVVMVMLLVSRGKSKGRVREPAAACRPHSTFHETMHEARVNGDVSKQATGPSRSSTSWLASYSYRKWRSPEIAPHA
jgi:hypothetical protein